MNNEFPIKISSPIQDMHLPSSLRVGEWEVVKNFRKVFAGGGELRNFYCGGGGVYIVEMGSHNFEVKIKTA